MELTERSTKDAAAVKVLTIISLVYLPTTIVANFFSTQFIQTNQSGDMHVSANAWLLAAIAIPLTIITIAIWWLWAYGQFSRLFNITWKFLLFSRSGEQPERDIEAGDIKHRSTELSDWTLCESTQPTFSITASPKKKQEY